MTTKNKYINLLLGKKRSAMVLSELARQLKKGQRLGKKLGIAHARKK